MVKVTKLIAALLLVQAMGAIGMEYEYEEGIEISAPTFDSQLYVQNKTPKPLFLRWRPAGQSERRAPEALMPGALQLVGPISNLEYVDFRAGEAGKWNRPQNALAEAKQKAVRNGVIVLAIKAKGDAFTFDSELKLQQQAASFELEQEAFKMRAGMALLDFFPRVKAKLLGAYGDRLRGATIAEVERLIKDNKSLTASDFLDLSEGYTMDELNCAYESMDDQLERAQLAQDVESAIRSQLRHAWDAALAQLP